MRGLLAVLLLLGGCDQDDAASAGIDAGGADAGGGGADAAAAQMMGCVAPPARTCAQVMAAFAASGNAGVAVTCDAGAGTFTMSASGVPPYMSNQSTPNAIDAQDWVVTLPLAPTCAAATTSVVASRGPIGFMINGVAFFGPQNMQGQDAPTVEGATLDDCDGHADPQCAYHYHSDPSCVFGRGGDLLAHMEGDGHPGLIGFALDGFPLYAPYPSAFPPALDGCNGHSDATRGYHFHTTSTSPYFVGCYVGSPRTPVANDRGCN